MSGQFAWAIERLGDAPHSGARVLLLGGPSADLAARSWTPVPVDDPDTFAFDELTAEAAVVVGVLEHTEWDRWLMQRIHRALVPGGRLLVTALNATAPLERGDVPYLVSGAMKTLRLRLTGRPGAFRGRRHRPSALLTMLETLGFACDLPKETNDRVLRIEARRLPSLYGLEPTRPFPDPMAFRARYEQVHASFIATRDAWAKTHRAWCEVTPRRELDPAAYRGTNALVLAPHPDDELIGCGGTSVRLVAAGCAVHVVQATDGSDAASLWRSPEALKRTVRLEESARVAREAGYASSELWREPNDAFGANAANVDRLVATLERVRPRIVFVPFVSDIHPDHVALTMLLARALERVPLAPDAEVASYEVWGLVPANTFCDVTGEMPRLERLLWLYETAMKVDDYVHFCADRNHYNALAVAGRSGFTEAFHVVPAARFPDLVRDAGIHR